MIVPAVGMMGVIVCRIVMAVCRCGRGERHRGKVHEAVHEAAESERRRQDGDEGKARFPAQRHTRHIHILAYEATKTRWITRK
jgi:hypothetical protein